MRRIVTGENQAGKSIILEDGRPPRILTRPEAPGVEVTEIWATHQPIPNRRLCHPKRDQSRLVQ